MKRQGWGRVVDLCSPDRVDAPVRSLEHGSAEEALRTVTRTAAREWAPTGVFLPPHDDRPPRAEGPRARPGKPRAGAAAGGVRDP